MASLCAATLQAPRPSQAAAVGAIGRSPAAVWSRSVLICAQRSAAATAGLRRALPPPAAFAATAAPSSTAVEGEGAVPGQPLHTAAAWTAADAKARPEDWQHVLTPAEADEIVAAARQAAASGIPVPQLTQADFPLPTLGPLLEQFRRNCLHGLGFQLLRGGC